MEHLLFGPGVLCHTKRHAIRHPLRRLRREDHLCNLPRRRVQLWPRARPLRPTLRVARGGPCRRGRTDTAGGGGLGAAPLRRCRREVGLWKR